MCTHTHPTDTHTRTQTHITKNFNYYTKEKLKMPSKSIALGLERWLTCAPPEDQHLHKACICNFSPKGVYIRFQLL